MANVGTVEATLRLNDQFTGVMAGAASQLQQHAQKMERVGRRMSSIGTSLSVAVTLPILAVGGAAIKMATDAVEAENLFEVSFGNMADAARKWSEETGRALGLNRVEMRKSAGTIFIMVEQMGIARGAALEMATGMTVLANDMASFFNLNPEEAFQKLRSGIVGETEPLRRLGILVDENTVKNVAYANGIAEVGSELTQTQKVAARWVAIQQQTVKVQGDLARTMESPANQMRRLKVQIEEAAIELGTVLLPVFSRFMALAQSGNAILLPLIQAFARLSAPLQTAAIALAGILVAAGPLLLIAGQLVLAWGSFAAFLPTLTAGIGSVVAVVTGPVGWIVAGAALLLAWRPVREFLVELGQSVIQSVVGWVKRFLAVAQEWWASTQEGRQFLAALARVILDDLGAAISRVVEFFRTWFGEQVRNLQMAAQMARAFLEWSGVLGLVRYEILRATLALQLLWQWTKKSFDAVVEWIAAMGGLAPVIGAFNPVAGAALMKMKEWSERAKNSAEWSRKLGEANRQLSEDTEAGVLSIEAMDSASAGVLAEIEKLTAKTKELSEEEKQRAEALKESVRSIGEETAANRALLAALKSSWEEYQILNTLLSAGIPLADALSGKYDTLARSILESEKNLEEFNEQLAKTPVDPPGLIGLPGIFQRIAQESERAMKIFAKPDLKGGLTGLSGFAERLAEIMRHTEQLFGGASKAVQEVDAAVRAMRSQEEHRKEILAEINRLLAAGVITQQEAVKIAEQLGAKMGAVAVEVEALMKRAWENVQDIAADAIAEIIKTGKVDFESLFDSILNIVAQMLAKMLVMWLINVGKRLVAEQTAAAASAASWSAAGAAGGAGGGGGGGGWLSSLGSLFGGGGGGGGSSAGWAAGGALGALAIVGVTAAFAYWAHSEAAKKAAKRWFGVAEVQAGWSAMFGSVEVLQVTTAIRDKVREIFAVIGGQLSSLPEITVDIQASGKQFRSFIDGILVGHFATFEEAFKAAALRAIEKSDLSRMIPEIAAAIQAGTIGSLEALERVAEVFSTIQQVTDPVTYQIRQFRIELEIMRQTLEDAGIAASALAEYTALGWQTIRDQITGAMKSAQQLFNERMEAFNRELEAEKAKQVAALATAQAEQAAAAAEVTRLQAQIAGMQALAFLTEKQAQLLASMLGNLALAEAMLAGAAAAAAAAQAALDAMPEPIKPSEFKAGGGGKGTAKADAERVAQAIADLTRALLPELVRTLAEVNLKYDELIISAKKDAEAITALNALREQELALIRAQIAEDFYGALLRFEHGGKSALGTALSGVNQEAEDLRERAKAMAEALGFAAERLRVVLGRINAAAKAQRAKILEEAATDTFLQMLDFLGKAEEAERLRFELQRAALLIAYAELQVAAAKYKLEVKFLTQMGALVNDIAAISFEDWKKLQAAAGGGGSGGGGGAGAADDAARKLADALNRLKEIQARSLSPFAQAIRGVVDEFAELRKVLGWTTQLQAVYAQELRRVIAEQVSAIQRMRDELNFRADAPDRSIDQFRRAQEQANEAVAALASGDFSELDRIPDLVARVLELNPSAQASQGSRFLFAWADQILAQTQAAAEEFALGIDPGGANDPFAWLRTIPTAGDDAVVAAVDRVAFRQDVQTAEEKAEAEREAAREQKRIERAAAKEERERAKAEARIEKIIQKQVNQIEVLKDIRLELRQGGKLEKAS